MTARRRSGGAARVETAPLGAPIVPLRWFLIVAVLPVLVACLVTTDKGLPYNVDASTNALTAWKLGTDVSIYLSDEFAGIDPAPLWGKVYWLTNSDGGIVSKYPPGAALLAAPAYALARSPVTRIEGEVRLGDRTLLTAVAPFPPLWPASLVAALATASAVGVLAILFRGLLGDRAAIVGAWVAGLGTAAWSVAADGLMQHGPAMLWISLGMLMMDRRRPGAAGVGYGLAVFTRPQTAPIAAIVGLARAWEEKSVATLARFGIPASLGAVAYVVYNLVIFGQWLPTDAGGYFLDHVESAGLTDLPVSLARAAFDPGRGFLILSPFLLVLLPGLPAAWRVAPPWARASALGGAAYLVVQLSGNVWHGGLGHFGYRYPLEMLTAGAPLLALSFRESVAARRWAVRTFAAAAAAAVAIHGVGAWS